MGGRIRLYVFQPLHNSPSPKTISFKKSLLHHRHKIATGLGIILCKKPMEFEDENKGLMAKSEVLLIPVDVCHALGPVMSSVSSKVVSRTAVEGLPEGWIKEFRIRKRGGANTKDPPFWLDPSSDYALELNTTSVLILRSVLNISMGMLIQTRQKGKEAKNALTVEKQHVVDIALSCDMILLIGALRGSEKHSNLEMGLPVIMAYFPLGIIAAYREV
ncbi:hypothetical protein Tco_0129094 [Tanacetum coccineum]